VSNKIIAMTDKFFLFNLSLFGSRAEECVSGADHDPLFSGYHRGDAC
jgi:hypothetical protein